MTARRSTLSRFVATWLPVAVVYAMILATVPIGSFVALSLYRLGPDLVTARAPLPGPGAQVHAVAGGALVRLVDGRLWWHPETGADAFVETPAPCVDLGFHRNGSTLLCSMGDAGLVAIETGEGRPTMTPWAVGGPVTVGVVMGNRAAVGRRDGVVELWRDASSVGLVPLDDAPVRDLLFVPGGLAVAAGDALVLVELESDGTGAVVGRMPLDAPAVGLDRDSVQFLQVLSRDALWTVDAFDLARPQVLHRLTLPGPATGLRALMPTVTTVFVEGAGAHVVRDAGFGGSWLGPHWGERTTVTHCGGGWAQMVCVTPTEILTFDVVGYKDVVVVVVGILAALGLLSLLGSLVVTRPRGWPVRLAWTAGGVALVGWLLSSSLHSPIEALHILEYGVLGALLYRAIARQWGAGVGAAALALVVGWSAGLFDETLQWWHPVRTGAIEDVTLDAQAAGIGVIVGWLGLRLGPVAPRLGWRPALGVLAGITLLSAAFLQGTAGFATHYTEGALTWNSTENPASTATRDADPATRVAVVKGASLDYPDYLRKYADDRFLYELRVHVYRRDRRLAKGDLEVACGEQRLLQRLYPNALRDTPFSWGTTQRAACEPFATTPYASPVADDHITSFTAWQLWLAAIGLALALAGAAVALGRRR